MGGKVFMGFNEFEIIGVGDFLEASDECFNFLVCSRAVVQEGA